MNRLIDAVMQGPFDDTHYAGALIRALAELRLEELENCLRLGVLAAAEVECGEVRIVATKVFERPGVRLHFWAQGKSKLYPTKQYIRLMPQDLRAVAEALLHAADALDAGPGKEEAPADRQTPQLRAPHVEDMSSSEYHKGGSDELRDT